MKGISISVRCAVLTLFFSLLFSLSASAQQGKVSVDLRNVSLKEFFNVIEQQTDYRFSYRDSELDGKPSVTVKAVDADLAPVHLKPDGFILRTVNKYFAMTDGKESYKASGAALSEGINLAMQYEGSGYDPNLRILVDFGSSLYIIKEI